MLTLNGKKEKQSEISNAMVCNYNKRQNYVENERPIQNDKHLIIFALRQDELKSPQ